MTPSLLPLGRAALISATRLATTSQRQQWHDYTLASFLLAKGDTAYYVFHGSQYESALADWGEKRLAIGSPLGARTQAGNAWIRRFSNGIAVVNPGDTTVRVPLRNAIVPGTAQRAPWNCGNAGAG